MERETVDRLARATGCQVTPNVIGNPMFTMTTHELHMFAEKVVEMVVRESGELLTSDEFIGRSDLDWSMVLNEHFGVE